MQQRLTGASGAEERVGDDDPALPQEVVGAISARLRAHYGSVVAEPMPDRFARLLAELSDARPDSAQGRENDAQDTTRARPISAHGTEEDA